MQNSSLSSFLTHVAMYFAACRMQLPKLSDKGRVSNDNSRFSYLLYTNYVIVLCSDAYKRYLAVLCFLPALPEVPDLLWHWHHQRAAV